MATLPPYLAQLNAAQLAAVRYSGTNLLIHAGAGSGKTRCVIARIIYHILEQNIPPWHIMAVTFTNRAAREMRQRLAASLDPQQSELVTIRTFHSFGAWFLRRHTAAAGLAPDFNIYDDDDSLALLKQAWGEHPPKVKLYRHLIAKAKEIGLGCDRKTSPSLDQLMEFSREPNFPTAFYLYQQALERSGNVDFADLLALPIQVLERQTLIREKMQWRFQRLLVDEYQDSSPLQNRLLKLLLATATTSDMPPQQELCIVGDDDQSIYGFRGAQVCHILEFKQNFAPATILKLEQNYRSYPPILELANQVIEHNRERLGKQMQATRKGGDLPQFHLFANCEQEATFVAQCICQRPLPSTAILYRTNAQSRAFERVLREWGLSYRLVGNVNFHQREEIKDVVAFLKCLANPRDLVAFARVYNKPKRGLGPRALQSIASAMPSITANDSNNGVAQAMQQILEAKTLASRSLEKLAQLQQRYSTLAALLNDKSDLPLGEFIETTLERSGLRQYYIERDQQDGRERCINFDLLLKEAGPYGSGRPALVAFLESIQLETEELEHKRQHENGTPPITLITMHNTKGLEFARVFITGLERGLFPRDEGREMQEERRLFYVAITRAQEELYLCAAKSRWLYNRSQRREVSPLLREIDPAFYHDYSRAASPAKKSRDEAGSNSSCEEESGQTWRQLSPQALQHLQLDKEKEDPFVPGARVEHLEYGLGYVVQRKHSGTITTLIVKLDDGRLIRVQLEVQGSKLEFLGLGI